MKNRKFFALIGIFALGGALYAGAQDYDDIYYDASKTAKKETVKKSSGSVSLTEQTQPTTVQTRVGKSTVTPVSTTPRVKVERDGYRDDDEYNRRGDYELTNPYDTTAYDDEGSFSNTQRIERFYNPEIIKGSDDEELITLYYEDQPTVNLIIGSNWGPSYWSGWGWSSVYYSPWYGGLMCDYYPWYTGWYPSWYYNWHYGWHHGLYGWGYWDSWAYRPWGYGWGYHHPWDHWGYGWGHGYRDGWRHNHGGMGHAGGRRPSSIGRGYGYNKGGNGVSGVRSNGNGIGRRPSTGGIINNDRPTSRPGVRYGSANGNYGGGGGSGTVGGHRNPSRGNVGTSSGINRSTQSSGGRSYTPSRSYGGSSSSSSGRSYGGSSSSSGRSYGGSSNIGGGRSSGGYSGGHSSGGSHSSGGHSGGGGGHRR